MPSPPKDLRSDLRRAMEEGDYDGMAVAIADRTFVPNPSGCWIWPGRVDSHGYPKVKVGRRDYLVHRLSLEAKMHAKLGSQPAHHICANIACVNPDHLVPVTHGENIAEMLARRAYQARIRELEAALAEFDQFHPLLTEIVPCR